ncbi:hypothetical protein LTR56_005663 [Elasticomyces elasticus]|nr:hypothetical protein LTR56_005663 [Elasticomyces elasticus]KAK3663950.1 hypothetical protein LTR22_005170 [Elasticomyces elasticus]KAK4927404.1 hypothetical protein LTR49_005809 [Elasticomyces elasticus]KAK5763368.1 hypothetical protein LTS12_006543 [Elasticomyces elasticus]
MANRTHNASASIQIFNSQGTMPPIYINGTALAVPRGHSSWSLIGGRMIRDDQMAGARHDYDDVERRDRARLREERYTPPARHRFERPVEDRYSITSAYIRDREYRSRRMATEAPRTPPTQSTHNDRVADGGITKPTTSSGRHAARKRERDRLWKENHPPFKQGEENEYGLAVGVDSVKSEGDGNAETSGDGTIIKAESFDNFAPSEVKQVKIEQGVMEDAKLLIKCESGDQGKVESDPHVKDKVAEKIKAEHVDTIKIKVEGGDD